MARERRCGYGARRSRPAGSRHRLRNGLTVALGAAVVVLLAGCGGPRDAAPRGAAGAPLVVHANVWEPPMASTEADILARRILPRPGSGFGWDPQKERALAHEIERVLSRIRDAHPVVKDVTARERFDPWTLILHLEPDLYGKVSRAASRLSVEPVPFHTGHEPFDTLNTESGLAALELFSFMSSAVFHFNKPVNPFIARLHYAYVEGVEHVEFNSRMDGPDVAVSKSQGAWYAVFRRAWGDCPSGCIRDELSFFIVEGDEVERIESVQAMDMPMFADLVQPHWGRHARAAEARALPSEVTKPRWEVGEVFRDCPGCPEMVVVSSGSFEMGSPESEAGRFDDEELHEVTIARPFAVGVHEVTRGEFARFVSATGRSMGNACFVYEGGQWEKRSGRHWKSPGFRQTDDHPVVCVNWNDAKAYVRWLSGKTGKKYRLLSEAEWEYVARAGTRTARYWGEGESGLCRYANGADASTDFDWRTGCNDGHARTAPVGSFHANGYQLHDVLGNVTEWVEDCRNDSYAGAPRDGSAWESGECSRRVLRGGSWVDAPRNLRSASRYWLTAGDRDDYAGFRVARTLTP